MRKALLQLSFGLIVILFSISVVSGGQAESYLSTDRTLEAKVSSIGKTLGSLIEVYGSNGKLVCKQDYTSKDGVDAFSVEHAGWTPDGQFFVFSTSSSGGHQPWRAFTFFYSRRDNRIHSLDEYLYDTPVAESEFVLKAPDTITVTIWNLDPVQQRWYYR